MSPRRNRTWYEPDEAQPKGREGKMSRTLTEFSDAHLHVSDVPMDCWTKAESLAFLASVVLSRWVTEAFVIS
jgi:hypothetical protein